MASLRFKLQMEHSLEISLNLLYGHILRCIITFDFRHWITLLWLVDP